jgi:hypothetical protein
LCHGEVELLRQHVDRLADARSLAVSAADIAASAHEGESCASCHTGFRRWPHPEGASTATCASCHEDADALWHDGVHARADEDGVPAAACSTCHGVHDVLAADALDEGAGMEALDLRCMSCHETSGFEPGDPHAGEVSCAACHAAHDVRDIDDPEARASPARQVETCGACHEAAAGAYPGDAHGSAVAAREPTGLSGLALMGHEAPPTCTSCHGSHGMLAVASSAAAVRAVERCTACHQDWSDRYFGTYHGKATALGSEIVATCDDCHSAHEILAASEPASWVHPDRVVETCATCHEHARPAFAAYDSHPDPMDRSRNAPLFYSFVFMNTLLVGVIIVFGLHTALWWMRILIERRRHGEEGAHV